MDKSNPYASPRSELTRPSPGAVDTTNPLDPKGRFTRLSWLAWSLVLTVLAGLALLALTASGLAVLPVPDPNGAPPMFLGVWILALQVVFLVLYLILAIRRFHDINASGWWSAALIVPIANVVAALVLLFKRGDASANRFGPPRPTPGWEQVLGIIYIVLMILGLIGIIAAIAFPAYMHAVQPAGR